MAFDLLPVLADALEAAEQLSSYGVRPDGMTAVEADEACCRALAAVDAALNPETKP